MAATSSIPATNTRASALNSLRRKRLAFTNSTPTTAKAATDTSTSVR